MDYSYRHFYHDGYGKDFRVLNLSRARENQAYDLLVGGLLAFYQQYHLFHKNNDVYRPYNLEKPLWVFLGSSVKAISGTVGAAATWRRWWRFSASSWRSRIGRSRPFAHSSVE